MRYEERPVLFDCQGETLVGILTLPGSVQPLMDTGLVVIVGGPQYRVGSHRQFLLLARELADAGFPILRFDVRGMGDSTGASQTFEQITPDIGAAIDALQRAAPYVSRVALWGLCDAASAALLYCDATRDQRVRGLCLLNPWVRTPASLARTHVKRYYANRLTQSQFWIKLFSGKVAPSVATDLWRSVRLTLGGGAASTRDDTAAEIFQRRMARSWIRFGGHICLFLSGNDYTAKEFLEYAGNEPAWDKWDEVGVAQRHDLPVADHTFSDPGSSAEVIQLTIDWLRQQR